MSSNRWPSSDICSYIRDTMSKTTSICRYVTLTSLHPRHLSQPLACRFSEKLPCGCSKFNTSVLPALFCKCGARKASSLSPFVCLHPSVCCHASWAVWCYIKMCSTGKRRETRQEEGKRKMEENVENQLWETVGETVGEQWEKWNAICSVKIGHCFQGDCSIQTMTLKRHSYESVGCTRTWQKYFHE